jgi:hypothetical protein
MWKKWPKNIVYLNFQKIAQEAKIRPVLSPWFLPKKSFNAIA